MTTRASVITLNTVKSRVGPQNVTKVLRQTPGTVGADGSNALLNLTDVNGVLRTRDGSILVWDLSSSKFIMTSIVDNQLVFSDATGSSSSTTGALVISGGVGIGQNLNVVGTLNAGLIDGGTFDGKPNSRQTLIDYCLRKLGAPVLEINVDDDQIDDLVDDAIQYFNERHFDGVERMYLKYEITEDDISRGKAGGEGGVGIVTTSASSNIVGTATTFNYYENSNYIQVPDSVVGIEKIFKVDTSSISSGMFSIKYQLFLNDLYYFNSVELLQYAMVKSYLEDIDFLLTTDKQIRFNKRQDRLYLDLDWSSQTAGTYLVLDCFRAWSR